MVGQREGVEGGEHVADAVILDHHGGLLAGERQSSRDANALFFAGDRKAPRLGLRFEVADDPAQRTAWQREREIQANGVQSGDHGLTAFLGTTHGISSSDLDRRMKAEPLTLTLSLGERARLPPMLLLHPRS